MCAVGAQEVFMFMFSSVGLALSQRNFTFLSIPGRGRRRRRRNSRSSSPRRRRTIRGGVRGAISNTLNLQGIGCFRQKSQDAMFWCFSVIHWCDLFWCQSFPVYPILNPFPLSAPEAEEVFMFTFSSVGLALSQRNFTFLSIPGRGSGRWRH